MGRPVSMRVSYREDASYLLRLEAAIGKDTRQTRSWRVKASGLTRKLALILLQADGLRIDPFAADLLGSSHYGKRGRSGKSGKRRSGTGRTRTRS